MTPFGLQEGFNGFGLSAPGDVMGIEKALGATYGTPTSGGDIFRVESLEASLKLLSWGAEHAKLTKKLSRTPAYNVVESYNQQLDYGAETGGFVRAGERPPSIDGNLLRQAAFVKYLGTTREVEHPLTLVASAHGDVISAKNHEGIMWMLGRMEPALFQGDSSLVFSGEGEQWDGLDVTIDAAQTIDNEGDPLQEATVATASQMIVDAYGYPTDCFAGTKPMTDLSIGMYPRERVNLPAPQNGVAGVAVTSILTPGGVVELNPDVFLRRAPSPPAVALSTEAPAAPQLIAASVNVGVTNGDWTKGNPAGVTFETAYLATMCNRKGESAPCPVMAANASMSSAEALAGNRMDVVVTNAAAIGSYPPEYIRLYRAATMATGTTTPPATVAGYSLIMQVPVSSQAPGATTTIPDVNLYLPFTYKAYVLELRPSSYTLRQLLPLIKMPLSVVAPSFAWMLLLYAVPIHFTPRKAVRIINCGVLS